MRAPTGSSAAILMWADVFGCVGRIDRHDDDRPKAQLTRGDAVATGASPLTRFPNSAAALSTSSAARISSFRSMHARWQPRPRGSSRSYSPMTAPRTLDVVGSINRFPTARFSAVLSQPHGWDGRHACGRHAAVQPLSHARPLRGCHDDAVRRLDRPLNPQLSSSMIVSIGRDGAEPSSRRTLPRSGVRRSMSSKPGP